MDSNFVLAVYELEGSGELSLRSSPLPISVKSPLLKKDDDMIDAHLVATVAYDLRYYALLQ